MSTCTRIPAFGAWIALVSIALSWSAALRAQDLDATFMLVAQRQFQHQFYGHTILVAKPIGDDRHVGFILNRPTPVTLGAIYPDKPLAQKMVDPIYLGGPYNTGMVMAIVQRPDSPGGMSMRLDAGLFLAVEAPVIDRIASSEAERARFVAGMVLWDTGELREEVARGFWHVSATGIGAVLGRAPEGLWEELVGQEERAARGI